ncbi:uncharacterized protein LOC119002515 isoform X2 [Sturnira hondurensis]|uniref:uncharacterized protein LOC119002515 isoform X2 n=1 Tax=Sturnira hondurensis TaxID=192404 RepID=UPI001879C3E3|nr:uncharacterized protein LOC119002515 isoform X2 [Sturnira hondurensis]
MHESPNNSQNNFRRIAQRIVIKLCFLCSVMSEEVTYATLQFPNPSKSKKLQESFGLKKTELELNGAPENRPGAAESTTEAAESRAMREHSNPWKVWGIVAFIVLMLNLAVMAGLGTLILMDYRKLFFGNRTAYDKPQSITGQWEKNITLYLDMYKNISNEHIFFKNMLENTLKELKEFTSKCLERLKKQDSDLRCCSCSKACKCQNGSKRNSSSLRCDSEIFGNRTQLLITCLPSPVSWEDLNCTCTEIKKDGR